MRDLSLVTHNSTKEAACADTEIKDTGKIDIATDEDCSSVQRIVSDWNDTLNTSTVMPHKAQSAIINPGCPAAGSSNNSSTANEIITVRKIHAGICHRISRTENCRAILLHQTQTM